MQDNSIRRLYTKQLNNNAILFTEALSYGLTFRKTY